MRTIDTPLLTEDQLADSATADLLLDALYRARAGRNLHVVADLEDAVFGLYLPMARTLAHTVVGESVDRQVSEQSAELGLAHAVLAWRQRASGGFRRFARFSIVQQLQSI